MRIIVARFGGALLLLAFLFVLAGAYYYYTNYGLSAEKLVKRALRNGERLKSYYGALEMTVQQREREQRYFAQVWFSAPSRYRVEVFASYVGDGPPAQVFICDGEKRWLYSPEVGDFYLISPLAGPEAFTSPFLLGTFLEGMGRARNVELLGIETTEKGNYYLLKVIPAKPSREDAWGKVWLEKRSLMPVKYQFYDEQDRLYRTVTYKKIELNPRLSTELFRLGFTLKGPEFKNCT